MRRKLIAWVERRRSLLILTAILAIIAICTALISHWWFSTEGFFINLTTEFLGILVTVLLVNHLLVRQEQDRWRQTDKRIQQHIEKVVDVVADITSLLSIEEVPLQELREGNPSLLLSRLNRLDKEHWGQLQALANLTAKNVEWVIGMFQFRLNPDTQLPALLDMHESALKLENQAKTCTDIWDSALLGALRVIFKRQAEGNVHQLVRLAESLTDLAPMATPVSAESSD